jgi:hypothetical protein
MNHSPSIIARSPSSTLRHGRWLVFRRVRQGTLGLLLAVVAGWGLSTYVDDHRTFAWTRPVSILLVPLLEPGVPTSGGDSDWILHRFLSTTSREDGSLSALSEWFKREFRRYTGRDECPLRFSVHAPVRAPYDPPEQPRAEDSFLARWSATSHFLAYFKEVDAREHLFMDVHDVTVFVFFYGEGRSAEFKDRRAVAAKRTRWGLVFCPMDPAQLPRSSALVAHEICHTLGATDKYDGEKCVFPDGYANPGAVPLLPQSDAEIMALGIPLEALREAPVTGLLDCVVGSKTSEEMGWRREP